MPLAARLAIYIILLFAFLAVGLYGASFLPRDPLGSASWVMIAAATLAASWVAISHLDGRPLGALGFPLHREAISGTIKGVGVGAALIGGAIILLAITGTVGFRGDSGTISEYLSHVVIAFLFFFLAAAAEELIFRGYAFQALVEGVGAWPTVIVSSALFSWLHAGNPGIDAIAFFNIFLAGIVLALAYLRTRSLWFATAVHAGWNWTMAALLGFPVSGLTGFDTPLYDAVESGPRWWTGGDFGPEAGLAGTIALVAAGVWMARTPLLGESDRMRELRPLVDVPGNS
jgi:membrane protease YdiL (CAAX protease family)